MRRPNSLEQELQGFSSRILSLVESGQPVKIQVGFGWTPAAVFVNLDIHPLPEEMLETFYLASNGDVADSVRGG